MIMALITLNFNLIIWLKYITGKVNNALKY